MKIFRANLPLDERAQWVKDFDGTPKIVLTYGTGSPLVSVTADIRKQRLELFFTRSEVARMLATFS